MHSSEEDKKHKRFYQKSIERYGAEDIRALHWNSLKTQEARFKEILQASPLSGKSILDLGCGKGDFLTFLHRAHITPLSYVGVDFISDFIDLAIQRYPSAIWYCDDFFSIKKKKFDVIICNGALNIRKKDNIAFLQTFLTHFMPMARENLIFTLLKEAKGYLKDPMIYTYSISEVRSLLRHHGVVFDIREGYMDNDFTCVVKAKLPL